MMRMITVGPEFPMASGDTLIITKGDERVEYRVIRGLDNAGRVWEAQVMDRSQSEGNKDPAQGGKRKIQKLRANYFPTPEEIFKRMERD